MFKFLARRKLRKLAKLPRKFICESCEGVFTNEYGKEDCNEEHSEPKKVKGLACDECHAHTTAWLNTW